MKKMFHLLWPKEWRLSSEKSFSIQFYILEELISVQKAPVPSQCLEPIPDDDCRFRNDQILEICTQLFRIEKNTRQLAEKEECRQTRGLERSQKRIRKVLTESEIDFKDLSGETFHPGRKDIDVLASDESSEIKRAMIDKCETPFVSVAGKVIQKAKATVLMPKKTRNSS